MVRQGGEKKWVHLFVIIPILQNGERKKKDRNLYMMMMVMIYKHNDR